MWGTNMEHRLIGQKLIVIIVVVVELAVVIVVVFFLRPVVCNAESAFFCDFLNVMQQKIDYSICAEQSDYYSLDDKPAIRCLY